MNVFVSAAIYLLEALFVIGIVGAVVVILISTVEDFEVLVEKDATPTVAEPMQNF